MVIGMIASKRFRYLPVSDAVRRVLSQLEINQWEVEEVPLVDAFGRVLAEEVKVNFDIPPYDTAHFDGYAVNYEDTLNAAPKNPIYLTVKGYIPPNKIHDLSIGRGEVYTISTGAYLPRGANAIIPIESVRLINDGKIEVRHPSKLGDHVIWKGSDFKFGEIIFTPGHVLRPQDIGLLAYLGFKRIKVYVKPRISIISVGDELLSRGFSDHTYVISGLVKEYGGIPIDLGVIGDDVIEIRRALSRGLEEGDLVITIGGCSVGKKDLVPDAAMSFSNSKIVVRGLKRVPGRQTSLAIIDGKPVLMLPGLIQSMIVGFYSLGIPILRKLTNSLIQNNCIAVRLFRSLELNYMKPFERVVFGKIIDFNGLPIVKPLTGYSMLRSIVVRSDGFIIIPPFETKIDVNKIFRFNLFRPIL